LLLEVADHLVAHAFAEQEADAGGAVVGAVRVVLLGAAAELAPEQRHDAIREMALLEVGLEGRERLRGFLQPLLQRALGPWLAILLAATGFALLHGQEYQWFWQQLLVVGLAGAAFGFARYKTGSTAAAALLHGGYNLTFFVGYLIQTR